MDDPRAPRLSDEELARRLLAYDQTLAAGDPLPEADPAGLPEELREGISCLDMLEGLRQSEAIVRRLGPLTQAAAHGVSRTDPPISPASGDSVAEAGTPAQLGRFDVLGVLGEGGCGVVFRARDPALHRQVAIKVPRPEALLTHELRQRFLREGRAAAGLNHPHIVTVYEAGQIGTLCYLASAYCPGVTLRHWLAQHGPAPPRAAAALVATLADAMHYAHQKGVCHRDLKPSNILLEPGRRDAGTVPAGTLDLQRVVPKIIDFGLAKLFDSPSAEEGTRTGVLIGTPQYMAPEQAEGHPQRVGPTTDVHALGVILYELLTGRPPYRGGTDLETLSRVVAASPESPRRLRPQVPRDLETICLKCLQKQPADRYASMNEFGDDLRRFLDGRPIRARRAGWADRAVKWIRRRPRATAAGVLAGVVLFSLVGLLVGTRGRDAALRTEMENVREEIARQKSLADQQDWLSRNIEYAGQIRSAGRLKSVDQLGAQRDLLLAATPGPGQTDLRGFEWHYLWRRGQLFFLPTRAGAVTAVAYSQSGERCASGQQDGTVTLYDTRTGRPLACLQDQAVGVKRLQFLKDDTQLLSVGFDKAPSGYRSEFVLWGLGAENKVLRRGDYSHDGKEFGHLNIAIAPAAQTLFVIDHRPPGHRLLALDLDTGSERPLLAAESLHWVTSTPVADKVAIAPLGPGLDGKLISNLVEIVEPVGMRRLSALRFDKPVHTAEFSPDGRTLALAVGGDPPDHRVEIREAPSLRLLHTLPFASMPSVLRFDGHGARLAVLTVNGDYQLFDVRTGQSLGSFPHESHPVLALAFSPDGGQLAVGDDAGRVRTGTSLLEPPENSLPGPPPQSEAWCMAFTPDSDTLAAGYDHEAGSDQQTLRLIDLTTRQTKPLPGHDATVMALAMSPDGKTLASASFDRTVRLWDADSGKCLHECKGHTGPVRALAFSPAGDRVASAGSDLFIKTWNVHDGSPGPDWRAHADMIRSLAFSPDGRLLVSASNDRTIRVWNARRGTLVRTLSDNSQVQSVACSPDGSLIASGNENNEVELWHLASGSLWKVLPGHSGKVRTVAFSRDGKTLASGGEDKTVRLWNVVSGQVLLLFPAEHFVNQVAFHPRRPILAAALDDGTVKVWSGE